MVLVIALILCLLSGIGSSLILTSFGDVTVEKVSVVTDLGTIRGYLVIPNGVTSENPAPGIVVSHSLSSSAESVESWYPPKKENLGICEKTSAGCCVMDNTKPIRLRRPWFSGGAATFRMDMNLTCGC